MWTFYKGVYGLSKGGVIVAALALIWMACHIGLEIVLRFCFSTSTYIAGEYVGYCLAISTVWSLGYALENGALIRVDLCTKRLSRRLQDGLAGFWAILTAVLVLGLANFFLHRTLTAWSRGTTSSTIAATPAWIPECLVLIGLVLFALQLVAFGLRHFTGHPSAAGALPASSNLAE